MRVVALYPPSNIEPLKRALGTTSREIPSEPDPGTNSEPPRSDVEPCCKACAGHTSPIPPSLGATLRQVVPEVDEEQAPPVQAAWRLPGGGRSLMTPG